MTNDLTVGLVEMHEGKPMASSLVLAEKVGKEHKNVLRDVQTLGCSEGFRRLNFEPANYPDAQGKPRPMIWMTRDGLTLLLMGYNGPEVMPWKERYIAAFNGMEEKLVQLTKPNVLPLRFDPEAIANTFKGWIEDAREQGRKEVTRDLAQFYEELDRQQRDNAAALSTIGGRLRKAAGLLHGMADNCEQGIFLPPESSCPREWRGSAKTPNSIDVDQVALGLGFKKRTEALSFLEEKVRWLQRVKKFSGRDRGSYQAEFDFEVRFNIAELHKQAFCDHTGAEILLVTPLGRAFLEARLAWLYHLYDLRPLGECITIRGMICGGTHAGELPALLEAFRTDSAPPPGRFSAPLPPKLEKDAG